MIITKQVKKRDNNDNDNHKTGEKRDNNDNENN